MVNSSKTLIMVILTIVHFWSPTFFTQIIKHQPKLSLLSSSKPRTPKLLLKKFNSLSETGNITSSRHFKFPRNSFTELFAPHYHNRLFRSSSTSSLLSCSSENFQHLTGVCTHHSECVQHGGTLIGDCFGSMPEFSNRMIIGDCCLLRASEFSSSVSSYPNIAHYQAPETRFEPIRLEESFGTSQSSSVMPVGNNKENSKTEEKPLRMSFNLEQQHENKPIDSIYSLTSSLSFLNRQRHHQTNQKSSIQQFLFDETSDAKWEQLLKQKRENMPGGQKSSETETNNFYEVITANNRIPQKRFETALSVLSRRKKPNETILASESAQNLNDLENDVLTNQINVVVESLSPKFNVSNGRTTSTTTTTIETSSLGTSSAKTTAIPTSTMTPTIKPKANMKRCGVRPLKPRGRVVGGRNAQFGEWPWQVLIKESTWLGFFMKSKCGGVLISSENNRLWVLTAAHCQPGMMGSLIVMLGQHELPSPNSNNNRARSRLTGRQNLKPIVRTVRRMIIHRDYNPETFDNDIALLELDAVSRYEDLQPQPHIVPICLPENEEDYVGKFAFVAGWGKLSYGGLIPNILQTVRLPIIDNNVCQKMFSDAGHYKYIKKSFLCAGYPQGGRDTCEGDSGGPLMKENDGQWTLIGTVSHGIKCAEPNLPGVYMKTFAYLDWIKKVIERY